MIFVKIENGLIVERVASASCPEGYELDKTGTSRIGYKRAIWDDDWNIKSLSKLVSEGIEEIPIGYKLSDDGSRFVEMTDAEKITAGTLKPNEKEKLVDGKIIPKTMDELYTDGLVSKDDYNLYITAMRQSSYASETDALFWKYQEGEITKDVWLKAKNAIRDKYKKVE